MIDVALVTQTDYLQIENPDDYHQNILTEDSLLSTALEKMGLSVVRVGWDDPSFDWTSTRLAVIRGTWDYFHRIDEYRAWLSLVARQTILLNTYDTVNWNLDKHYLLDCHLQGINIPETHVYEVGEKRALEELFKLSGWERAVLKPCVSGAARHTYVLDRQNVREKNSLFQNLVSSEAMMLQRFQPSVMEQGEWTLVMIAGKYTHAVLKKVKPGDFRVQDDFGGTVHEYEPTKEEIAFAEKTMSLVEPIPVYGRVDIIRDIYGNLALQELELIEPELWFRNCPKAADQLARAIARKR